MRGSTRTPAPPLLVALSASVLACDTDVAHEPSFSLERMTDQKRFEPYESNPLFPDDAAMRRPPEGTVPRATPRTDDGERLTRGRERFRIFCAPCHGVDGSGASVVAEKMLLVRPPSLHQPRLRDLSDEALYRVIQQGYGLMPSYAAELPVDDRRAIVAYVRVLQDSQHVALDALPEDLRREALERLGGQP